MNNRVFLQFYKMDTYNYIYIYTRDIFNYMSSDIYTYNIILIY